MGRTAGSYFGFRIAAVDAWAPLFRPFVLLEVVFESGARLLECLAIAFELLDVIKSGRAPVEDFDRLPQPGELKFVLRS